MRFLCGFIAIFLWAAFGLYFTSKGIEVSNDMQLLTCAIVCAGAMAGGD